MNLCEKRQELLEVDADRVHRDGNVSYDGEGQKDEDEFPKVAEDGDEHLVQDASYSCGGVGGGPGGYVGGAASYRGAEDEKGDRREEEAEVGVGEDAESGIWRGQGWLETRCGML